MTQENKTTETHLTPDDSRPANTAAALTALCAVVASLGSLRQA